MKTMNKYIILLVCLIALPWQLVAQQEPLRVAMMLPLQSNASQRDQNMDRFVHYYLGALLAINEVQRDYAPIELHTYDVEKSTYKLREVLARPELDSMDMIIGPAYVSQVSIAAEWALVHQKRILFPFSSSVPGIENNPYVLQFNPSDDVSAKAMVNWMEQRRDSIHCILIEASANEIPNSVKALQQQLLVTDIPCSFVTIKSILADSLNTLLADGVENIILFNTERYSNVRTLMPYLMRAAQGKKLTLLSQYSWQGEAIALPQIYSTVFRHEVDIDSFAYGAEYRYFYPNIARVPSKPYYDLLGFDQMRYVLITALRLRENREDAITIPYMGLQSDMQFRPISPMGGYQNMNIHIVHTK